VIAAPESSDWPGCPGFVRVRGQSPGTELLSRLTRGADRVLVRRRERGETRLLVFSTVQAHNRKCSDNQQSDQPRVAAGGHSG
jgi:hypothetical protein